MTLPPPAPVSGGTPSIEHIVCDLLTGEATIVAGEGETRTETRAVYIPYATLLAVARATERAAGERVGRVGT